MRLDGVCIKAGWFGTWWNERAQNRRFRLCRIAPIRRLLPPALPHTVTMPPRKKAAPADISSNVTPDPPTTRTLRSSARLATQAAAVVAKSGPTTNGATSSKPASKAKNSATSKPKPASKTTKPASKARSKRTKADTSDDEDHGVRTSKKPKTATVDEEEEETMNVDAQDDNKDDEKDDNKDNKKADKKDDKKMVTFTLRQGSRQLTVVAPR